MPIALGDLAGFAFGLVLGRCCFRALGLLASRLSQSALRVLHDAMHYGKELWYSPLGEAVRAEAASSMSGLEALYRNEQILSDIYAILGEEKSRSVRDALYNALLHLAAAPPLRATEPSS